VLFRIKWISHVVEYKKVPRGTGNNPYPIAAFLIGGD